jgi:hypothetical protein
MPHATPTPKKRIKETKKNFAKILPIIFFVFCLLNNQIFKYNNILNI